MTSTETNATEQPVAKGALVFYINVGQIPPVNAEAFLDRVKDNLLNKRADKAKLPEDIAIFFVPVRPPQETLVEFVPFAITEAELLDDSDLEALEEVGEEFVHELELSRKGCCGGNRTACCQGGSKPAETGGVVDTLKGWCRKVFGKNCCS